MAGPSGDGLEFVFIEGVKFTGIRTPEEQRAFLQDTLSVFDGTGVRWDQMSPQECEKLGYTVNQFARAIKNINQLKDVDSIEKAWMTAMKGGGIAMMHMMEMLQLSRSSYGSDIDLPTFSQTPSWVFLFLQVVTALIRTVQSGGL